MINRSTWMNVEKKITLATTAVLVIALSLATCFVILPRPAQAQTSAKAPLSLDERVQERAQRLVEQRMPRTVAPFDPEHFDKYVGVYQVDRYAFMALTREGEHFFAAHVGGGQQADQKIELYPESPTKFFTKSVPFQISFVLDSHEKVTETVFHSNGFEGPWSKVDESFVEATFAELAQRIKNKTPSPGTEAALRRYIEAFQHGQPNYDDMILIAALLTRERLPKYVDYFQKWGALKSLTFVEVMPNGFNKYLAVYEHGHAEMTVEPLSPDGKIDGITIDKTENQ